MKYGPLYVVASYLAICAWPALAQQPGTATLAFTAANVRDEGVTIRGARLEQFDVPGCAAPRKLTNFFIKRNTVERTADPVTIPVGAPIGLTFSYSDARFKQNRSCAVSGRFEPQPGRAYIARLNVTPNVEACSVEITSRGTESAGFVVSPTVCESGLKEELVSGSGYWLNWNIHVRVQSLP
jgi:hypothetical protein